ncbi:hypothetical protein PUN28_006639 [Cardiocondyla obscurior]
MQLYNLHENSAKNSNETYTKIQKENEQTSRANSTEVNEKSNFTREFDENLTKIGRENNSISYKIDRNFNTDDYNDAIVIVSNEACENETCIQLCCPFGDRLTLEKKCIAGEKNYSFPDIRQNNSEIKKLDEVFQLTVRDPCVVQRSAHRVLNPGEYAFLVNGSLYEDPHQLIPSTSYCLGVSDRNIYDAIVCMNQIGFPTYMSVCLLVSLPFLLLTFVVYSILPEVQNVHSYTLRVHVASLFTTNVVIFCVQEIPELSEWKYCIPLAYIFNFSMLSGCFWLNATCFDIWWTFRKLNLHQKNKNQKKRKFIIYSLYAWGVTFSINVACAIMDHAPGIPKSLIRPEMCKTKFWFGRDDALTVYYYGPTGAALFANICFFVATALAILYHNKHTAHQLKSSESRRYEKRKRKFNTYLKLFIVMGVSWSMGIILWLINASDSIPQMVWNISYTIDILQGVIIFVIYVCKQKIFRLLLKRFGWQKRIPFSSTSTSSRCTRTSSTMSYVSSISESVSMQKITPSVNPQTNQHVEPSAI